MSQTKKDIQRITTVGILLAVTVIFQFINNYIPLGFLPFNLALFPIALGAIMYGPLIGLFLGVIDGAMILAAPSTGAIFMSYNAPMTVILCLGKTGIAGLVSGFIFMPFKGKKELLGSILASVAVPIINTGLFYLAALYIFYEPISSLLGVTGYANLAVAILVAMIGVNFLIELAVNGALSPVIYNLYRFIAKRQSVANQE